MYRNEVLHAAAIEYVRGLALFDGERALFVHVPKCASTYLLSLALSTQGFEVDDLLRTAKHPEIEWQQGVWAHLDQISNLVGNMSPSRLEEVLGDPMLQPIAFVRHPVDRLWSAWASKILSAEPAYINALERVYEMDGIKLVSSLQSSDDLVQRFNEFIDCLDQGDLLGVDPHFLPQVDLVQAFGFMPRLYPLTEVDRVIEDTTLRKSLTVVDRETAFLRRPPLANEIVEKISRMYEMDMGLTSFQLSDETPLASVDAWVAVSEALKKRVRAGYRLAANLGGAQIDVNVSASG